MTLEPRLLAPNFRAGTGWELPKPINNREELAELIQAGNIFPAHVEFCNLIKNPNKEILTTHRIGSESSEAEVYEIMYFGSDIPIKAALKIMPISSPGTEAQNMKEIDYAIKASNLVRSGVCERFPLVFDAGTCPNTAFQNSKFQEAAANYTCLKLLLDKVPTKQKQLQAEYRQGRPMSYLVNKYDPDMDCSKATASSMFLISELADTDLNLWARSPHPKGAWLSIMSQVFEGIYFLHQTLRISHNDLHFGNVLLANYDIGTTALIHDFGKSEPLDSFNWKNDFEKFLSNFTESYQIPPEILTLVNKMETVIREAENMDLLYNNILDLL